MALEGVDAMRLIAKPFPNADETPLENIPLTWPTMLLWVAPVASRLAARRTRRVSRGFTTHVEKTPAAAPAKTDIAASELVVRGEAEADDEDIVFFFKLM